MNAQSFTNVFANFNHISKVHRDQVRSNETSKKSEASAELHNHALEMMTTRRELVSTCRAQYEAHMREADRARIRQRDGSILVAALEGCRSLWQRRLREVNEVRFAIVLMKLKSF